MNETKSIDGKNEALSDEQLDQVSGGVDASSLKLVGFRQSRQPSHSFLIGDSNLDGLFSHADEQRN